MAKIYVRTGMERIAETDRWALLISPLADELADSGLGELLELESHRREALNSGRVTAIELAFVLANRDYGLTLIDSAFVRLGLEAIKPQLPRRWINFHCDDYFNSSLSELGHWNDPCQNWDVWPATRVYEDTDLQMLIIGGPGVDGIVWGYRHAETGLWAWKPIAGEFMWLTASADSLIQDWIAGRIAV